MAGKDLLAERPSLYASVAVSDLSVDTELLGEADDNVSRVRIMEPDPECLRQLQEETRRKEEALKRIFLRSKCNIWESACKEIDDERQELNSILVLMGLPASDYRKQKTFPITDYNQAPNLKICAAKDYLDFYVFPTLLAAIQALIEFARSKRIFQCRRSTFNPSDYLSEYLYNYNPFHPERRKSPVPLFETAFAKQWLAKYPRLPLPKWLTMSKDGAALIIQRAYRGYLVRRREDVQELRSFWKALELDRLEEIRKRNEVLLELPEEIYDDVLQAEPNPPFRTHSEECELCARFREVMSAIKSKSALALPTSQNPNTSDTPGGDTSADTTDGGQLSSENPTAAAADPPLPPFQSGYDNCCFHPEGQLLFTKHHSSETLHPHPSQRSCLSKHPYLTVGDCCIKEAEQDLAKAKSRKSLHQNRTLMQIDTCPRSTSTMSSCGIQYIALRNREQ